MTAPAGYGKTTLATEWVQGRDDVVWYRATSGSADVAAFSAGLADVVAPLVPGAGERLKQRLRVADTPERAARPLAEILSEDLEEWPATALLIIDDYHFVTDSGPVEEFMDWLLMLTPSLHTLVTTRRRPRWASARRILYGEITEIDHVQLAMTTEEAALVLHGRSTEEVRALVQQAEGWPALIGLAALSATHEIPTERVSEALYRYFAEEVVRGEEPEVERFMLLASVPNEIGREHAIQILETPDPSAVFQRLVDEGILQAAGDRFRFHPLLRSFLRRLFETNEPELFAQLSGRTITEARASQEWEEGFDLAIETGRQEVALEILREATPSLLASGQTELLDRWLRDCGVAAIDNPGAIIARTELLIREGRMTQALPLIRNLATRLPADASELSRAWYLTGLASHLMSSEQEALEAHILAEQSSSTAQERSDALWGAYMAATELGLPIASTYLDEMENLRLPDPAFRLRIATGRMGEASTAIGSLRNLAEVFEPLIDLTDHVNDPMVQTSFLSRVAETQVTRAYYQEALDFAAQALRIAEALHLEFAIPFCLVPQASAEIGLKRFSAARQSLKLMMEMKLAREDPYLDVVTSVLQLKLGLAHPSYQFREAAIPQGSWERAHLALRAEALSLRALRAASSGDSQTAHRLARQSMDLSHGIDSAFTARFASLIAGADGQPGQDLKRTAIELVRDCAAAEAFEALVLASRASDTWLRLLKGDATAEAIAERTLARSGDLNLVRDAGLVVGQVESHESLLTPREREVLSYVARGFSNSAIATQLFISESTVKVHVHHILKKLGVETRLQAALKTALVDQERD